MKKALKITGIALLSLLVLVVAVCGIASWILFSSSGLKKTAQMAIETYSPCRIETGDISLSLIRTFPHAGLSIDDVTVFNEEGFAPSDTMLHAANITVQVDINAFRNDGVLKVQKLFVSDADALIYKDSEGRSNLDIFGSDKPEKEPRTTFPDSLNTKLSFDLEKLSLNNTNVCYSSDNDSTTAVISKLDANLKGKLSPAIDGKAGIELGIGNVSFIRNTAVPVSAKLDDLSVNADISLNNPDAAGTVTVKGSTAECTAGQMSAVMAVPNIVFDGNIGLGSKLIDGCLSVTSNTITATSPTLLASSDGLNLNVRANGHYTLEDVVSAVIDGTVRSVKFRMSGDGSSPMDASLGNIAIDATADADIHSMEGSASLKVRTDVLDFTGASKSAVAIVSDPLELSISGTSDNGIIHCISSINSSSLKLVSNGENYISNWPVTADIEAECDTAFHTIKVEKGSVSVNRQNVGLSGTCALNGKAMNASFTASSKNLDIEGVLAMLPSKLQKSLEGIRAAGSLSFDADGAVSGNDGAMTVRRGSVRVKANNFSGSINDSLSADADAISVVAIYPSSGGDCTADIAATGQNASISKGGSFNIAASDAAIHTSLDGFIGSSNVRKTIYAEAELSGVDAEYDTISANFSKFGIDGTFRPADGINNATAEARINIDGMNATVGENLGADMSYASIGASAELDSTKQSLLQKWNPDLRVHMENTEISKLDVPVFVPDMDFELSLGKIDIANSQISLGRSDFSLVGAIHNIGGFLYENGHMDGSLDFRSSYADLDELMSMLSGLGCEDGVLKSEDTPFVSVETNADTIENQIDNEKKDPNPFIVPDRMHIVLNTNIEELNFNRHKFYNMGGDITVKDGSLVLQELGFSSDAAEMQLTAIYRTPRPDNLYLGLDFHLLDIRIDELIDLIPAVDSIVPMLKAFDGKAQFHLAAETNTDGYYMPKMPTLIGAAAIEGKDLVVLDNEVFNSIKKKLMMSKMAENRIDSLSVELQVLRNKVDLYPFIVSMDRYSAVIGGRHNINQALDCNYHISVIRTPLPIRLGVDIGGTLSEIKASPMRHIKLTKCRYDNTFSPQKMNATDARVLDMKNAISETLKSNVR